MQRSIPTLPTWVTLLAVLLAAGIVTLLAFTLRRESAITDATERAYESSLLPDNWSTYGADAWSVGYPNDWKIAVTREDADGNAVEPYWDFAPVDGEEGKHYLFVRKETVTLDDVEAGLRGQPGMTRSEFRFASYPAVKFSVNGRDEYYISYNDDLYFIWTDFPSMSEVNIMLATFRFE